MARQSSIDRLPEDIREKLHELLRDPRVTQLEATAQINEILRREGMDDLSKSAVNRYDQQMRKHGERMRQAREVAEMWIGKMGAAPQGKLGHLVNEMLRTLSFDLVLTVQDGEINANNAPEVAKMLKDMAIGMEKLERAASENVKREDEIRKQTLARAAEAVNQSAKKLGVTQETIDEIHRVVLGI